MIEKIFCFHIYNENFILFDVLLNNIWVEIFMLLITQLFGDFDKFSWVLYQYLQ